MIIAAETYCFSECPDGTPCITLTTGAETDGVPYFIPMSEKNEMEKNMLVENKAMLRAMK